ncbi:MAG TPA: DUF1330 domain-containing protein [Bacteroidetes bacterium]|nr:DUF1330 domain-containing protein [Bacteroidota bacterium]
MNLHNQISPTPDQLKALMALPKDQPVVMLNILKFNGEEGKAAYQRYLQNAMPFVKKSEGKLIWKGKALHTVIGDPDDQPDVFLLVEYPSIAHFLAMVADPGYQEVAKDRTLGLKYGGLIASGKDVAIW